ncbi:uncharacterized protein I206_101006 [Kwoniella pini CBS 10737]|uniref:Uncharacterized protein n=1 Tax=Kwoniella pini CBS 10737 TaxID=1296096 RepID=A0A1B9IBQ1_9TREE|nr:uncharacterized protein I206_00320 [Kwoniella pini CBS 10737]OCF53019.1 hypothetical protein I206_00320 [Kwoniella pini CBS 10737]
MTNLGDSEDSSYNHGAPTGQEQVFTIPPDSNVSQGGQSSSNPNVNNNYNLSQIVSQGATHAQSKDSNLDHRVGSDDATLSRVSDQ